MEFLRAALERKAHRGAGRDAVVRWIVRGHHGELGDSVLRGHDVHAAGAAAIIGFATVDEPDVVALTQSVHADGEVGCHGGRRVAVREGRADAQTQGRKSREVAVLGCDFTDLLRADQGADHVGVGLDCQSVGFDSDRLGLGADGELDVDTSCLGHVNHDARLSEGLKSLGRDLQVVACGVQTGDTVQPGIATERCFGGTGRRIRKDDLGSRNNRSRLVCNDAGERGVGLRECSHACQHQEQRQQEQPVYRFSHVTFLFK